MRFTAARELRIVVSVYASGRPKCRLSSAQHLLTGRRQISKWPSGQAPQPTLSALMVHGIECEDAPQSPIIRRRIMAHDDAL